MTDEITELLNAWRKVPLDIADLIADRTDDELAALPGSEGLSLKELVHHIVEANIVASSMTLAALGASGSTFDWSWLWPNREWNDRLAYASVPTASSLKALEGLIEHISNLVAISDDGAGREVRLFDSPGAETYTKTVAAIIQQEVDHAAQHLADARRSAGVATQ